MRRSLLRKINSVAIRRFGTRFEPIKILEPSSNDPSGEIHYSYLGEEKILFDMIKNLETIEEYYVDIGAGDGVTMSNTARLAIAGWKGACFEFDKVNAARMAIGYEKFGAVSVFQTKVTPRNVCPFLSACAVPERFGVLSLDIDSYDFFVLQEILGRYRPSIIVAEINEKIPPPLQFTVLFDEAYCWDESHFFGQSICQLDTLCKAHDYALAALEYNNAFLIDTKRFPKNGLTPLEAYRTGYLAKPDRQKKFPWNSDMEPLLSMKPGEAVEFLNRYFKKFAGKYSLSM
jgi:hypothetical protein